LAGTARCDVLGVGQCSLDELLCVAAGPPPGGKARIHERHELPGGQIASALLGCVRLGLRASFVSSVGDDAAGAACLAPLRAAGVDLSAVRRVVGARSQRAVIWIDAQSGERTVLWERDAALALTPDALTPAVVAAARVLLLDAGDAALAEHAAGLARDAGIPCVLDADTPAPGVREVLGAVSHPVISQALAEVLYGSAERAVRGLAAEGAELAIVTLGRDGALAARGGETVHAPAFAIAPVDTTGAGDAFHAGVVLGLAQGLALPELLRTANAVAALNCRALGAQAGLPTRAELEAFLAAAAEPTPPRAR
jgi:sugar/nucleoside kinase (ribokinase family)